jgi:hypothetical protein
MLFDERARELAARRERLRMRSTELRLVVGRNAQVLQRPLAVADQVIAGGRWLREHPEWPVGTAVALIVMRPRRLLRWSGRLWWGWRLWRRASRLLRILDLPQR